jgi:hypothetical protein
MKYNKIETENQCILNSFNLCKKDFNEAILKDDDSLNQLPNYFTNVEIIDLDCIELNKAKLEKRLQCKTMDLTFAISDPFTIEMLLVELRFNYFNLSNLDRKELLGKVSGSINLLGDKIKINDNYIFIFKPELKQQAINRLQRMNPKIPNNYMAMDLHDLKVLYF